MRTGPAGRCGRGDAELLVRDIAEQIEQRLSHSEDIHVMLIRPTRVIHYAR